MKNYISIGDCIDVYYKVKQKGFSVIHNLLARTSDNQSRVAAKWNEAEVASDFWNVSTIRHRWNEKATGNPNLEYADYVVQTYFQGKTNQKLLSIGCGSGAQERKFAKYNCFSLIEGMDLSQNTIQEAKEMAKLTGFSHLHYYCTDFYQHDFCGNKYELILFNASLHHFDNLLAFIPNHILPLLSENGRLVCFEYVGANRLQWTQSQLDKANDLLKQLPRKYKLRIDGKSLKRKNYRPGLWRMLWVDPSESIDSESILPVLHQYFEVVEEKRLGGDILHLLLKDIAHNFMDKSAETQQVLQALFEEEDKFNNEHDKSDFIFGVYAPKHKV